MFWCVPLRYARIDHRSAHDSFNLVKILSETDGETHQTGIELKSLILAQIERWRNALHMQVERALGLAPKLVANG